MYTSRTVRRYKYYHSNCITAGIQKQPTRQTTIHATEINKQSKGVNTCIGTIATEQIDPWQDVPKQVFTSYFRLFILTAFNVVSRVGFLVVTGVCISILLSLPKKT